MAAGFQYIFWGIIFWFDLRPPSSGIDFLPDTLGYVLIIMGSAKLVQYSEHFDKVRKYSLILAVVAILDVVAWGGKTPSTAIIVGAVIYSLILTVLNLYLVYELCMAIAHMASKVSQYTLAEIARKRWTYYFAASLLMLLFSFLVVIHSPLADIMFIPLVFLILASIILLLTLLTRAKELDSQY